MAKRFKYRIRKTACALAAGFLFQAGGCSFDLQPLATGIANNLVTSFVFGAFNLPTRF